jgi:hypothetical protein
MPVMAMVLRQSAQRPSASWLSTLAPPTSALGASAPTARRCAGETMSPRPRGDVTRAAGRGAMGEVKAGE